MKHTFENDVQTIAIHSKNMRHIMWKEKKECLSLSTYQPDKDGIFMRDVAVAARMSDIGSNIICNICQK